MAKAAITAGRNIACPAGEGSPKWLTHRHPNPRQVNQSPRTEAAELTAERYQLESYLMRNPAVDPRRLDRRGSNFFLLLRVHTIYSADVLLIVERMVHTLLPTDTVAQETGHQT